MCVSRLIKVVDCNVFLGHNTLTHLLNYLWTVDALAKRTVSFKTIFTATLLTNELEGNTC